MKDVVKQPRRLRVVSYLLLSTICIIYLSSCTESEDRIYSPVIISFNPASGPVGTKVAVTGINFAPTADLNSVAFLTVQGTVLEATDTVLTVEVPEGAKSGQITVVVNGRRAVSTEAFTVTASEPDDGDDDDDDGEDTPVNEGGIWQAAPTTFSGKARTNAVAFAINGKGYLGMGINVLTAYADFYAYDAIEDVWTQKADFGGGKRYKAVTFVIDGKAYVATGLDGEGHSKKDLWMYDPAADSWTQKADYSGGTMSGGFGFAINGLGYVGNADKLWAYDPSADTWTEKTAYPGTADYYVASFVIDNNGYVGTGYEAGNSEVTDFWAYDATTDSWTQKTDVPGTPRAEAIGFTMHDKGYIGLGYYSQDDAVQRDFYAYDPNTDTWATQSSMSEEEGGLFAARTFVIGTQAYICTGYNTDITPTNKIYVYTPGN